MKQVVQIHNPRTGGLAMKAWAVNAQFSFQDLPKLRCRDAVSRVVIGRGFNRSADWVYLRHNLPCDLIKWGLFTKEWFDGCFRFAFVRNTWDKLVSHYECMRVGSRRVGKPGWKFLDSFNEYIRFVVSDDSNKRFWFSLRQHPYAEWGKDFVGRFESIDSEWERLCVAIGVVYCPLKKGGIKIRIVPRDYRDYYDRQTRNLVKDFYADDIERYDFTFEGNST